MVIKMPYGDVEILSKEDAIYFIKNRCNNCQHSTEMWCCSGYQASLCEEKEKKVIKHFKMLNKRIVMDEEEGEG